jgi:hypothetical protein
MAGMMEEALVLGRLESNGDIAIIRAARKTR